MLLISTLWPLKVGYRTPPAPLSLRMAARPVMRRASAAAALLVMPLPSQRLGLVLRADLIQLPMELSRVVRLAALAWTIMSLASRSRMAFDPRVRPETFSVLPEPGRLSLPAGL